MSVPMTLSDLERRGARSQIFQADLLNNARILFDLKRPNSARQHTWGWDVFLAGQPHPIARRRDPSDPQFWGFLSIYAYAL